MRVFVCDYAQFRATCSLHCDSSYLGYYSNSVSECLTIFCDVPVMIKVIKADLRMKIEGPRVHVSNRPLTRIARMKKGHIQPSDSCHVRHMRLSESDTPAPQAFQKRLTALYTHHTTAAPCVVTQETADAYFFILRNGDTLVLHGAAGQVCAHQVFAPVGYMCIRIRTFLLKN